MRGTAQWRRGRFQHSLELYRNPHRRTFFPFHPCTPNSIAYPLSSGRATPFYRYRDEHKTNTNKLFEQYDVQKNVDILHQVVTDARARRQRDGGTGVDNWRADLQPRAAVRARTIPVLERERDLLRARLAEVRFCLSMSPPILTLRWL